MVWERGDRGIDNAALAGCRMHALRMPDWYETLEGEPRERVREVWDRFGYHMLARKGTKEDVSAA